jgi:glycosyltransferase involved in cell wall biosynthesis
MTLTPVVTVGLPVYNGARFLARSIESLLGQDFGDFELVIADNASTDATLDICDDFARADHRVRVIRNSVNVGSIRNWNSLVHVAQGQYFKWASANDFCHQSMLRVTVGALARNDLAALAYGRTMLVDENGAEIRLYEDDFDYSDHRPYARFVSVIQKLRLNNAQVGLVRTAALRATGLERGFRGGDMVLMAELALQGHLWLLDDVLLYRRIGLESSASELTSTALGRFLRGAAGDVSERALLGSLVSATGAVANSNIRLREKLACCRFLAMCAIRSRGPLIGEVLGRRRT